MIDAEPTTYEHLGSLDLEQRKLAVYDRQIGMRLLFEDPVSGVEHYLVRYPAGLGGPWHRHSAAHTIVVLEGRLNVNGTVYGPGSYCHLPASRPMRHLPAGDADCLFLILFDGPSDTEPVDAADV
jgi:quercetin dioxygenase-like cupin family protein